MKNINITTNLNGFVGGEFQVQVVRKNGEVTYPLGEKFFKNRVLNSGLDGIFTATSTQAPGPVTVGQWASLMAFCRAGSGSTAVADSQTTLVTQLKSSNTYFSGSGANGTVFDTVVGSATHKRTYEFTAETGAVTYRELGIGPSGGGADLFSRVVLGADLNLVAGDNLRVVYQLTISIPQLITPTATTLSTVGWDATGSIKLLGSFQNIFGSFDSLGVATTGGRFSRWLAGMFIGLISDRNNLTLSTNATFPAVNVDQAATLVIAGAQSDAGAGSAYVSGQYYIDRVYTFTPSQPSTTQTGTVISISAIGDSSSNTWLRILLTAPQSKSNEYRLSFTFRFTWARA